MNEIRQYITLWRSKPRLYRFLSAIVVLNTVLLMSAFMVLSLYCYFSDSEIWLLSLSQKLFEPAHLVSLYYKPLFHIIVYFVSHFAPREADVYMYARSAWAGVALIAVALTAAIPCLIFKKNNYFFPTFIFCLSAPIMFNQGFRVRADILSLLLHAIIMIQIIRLKPQMNFNKTTLKFLALNLLMVMTSPKAVYFMAAQLITGLQLYPKNQKSNTRQILLLSHLGLGFLAPPLLLLTNNFAAEAYQQALNFFVNMFDERVSPFTSPYLSVADLYYLIRFFFDRETYSHLTFAHGFIVMAGIAYMVYKIFSRKTSPTLKIYITYATLIFVFVFFHNHKLPFFLGPYLAPFLAFSFCCFLEFCSQNKYLRHPILILPLLAVLNYAVFFQFQHNMKNNNNFTQMLIVNIFDEYTDDNPQYRYFDMVGILPRKNTIYHYVGPGDHRTAAYMYKELVPEKVDLILETYRFIYSGEYMRDHLTKNYVPIGPGLWGAGKHWLFEYKKEFDKKLRDQKMVIKVGKKDFWTVPLDNEYKYAVINNKYFGIDEVVLRLDKKGRVISGGTTARVAIPMEVNDVSFTNIEPLDLPDSPNNAFKYDTYF